MSTPPPNLAVVIAVMLTALLEVLDVSVVNVSLPHMIGAFGATPDQITWTITSYMISTAIVMPLTGYFSARFGRRNVLLTAISGFVVASGLCGAAWSLPSMVVFRLAQGAFGAVLIPLSQTVLLDAFPKEKHGKAMAIWGIAIMVAPIVGPTIGGYITEQYVWRWVFYLNVPLGLIALLLAFGQIPDTPRGTPRPTDWLGLVLMSLSLGSLQAVLDLGHHRDWFASPLIMGLAATGLVSGILFVVRGLTIPHNIIDLHLFRNRSYTLGCLLIAGYCMSMYATITVLPLLTQRLLGYPADTAGLIFLPRGMVSAVLMLIIGSYVVNRVDARKIIAMGLVFTTVACWCMSQFTLGVDTWGLVWPGMVQGIGMAMIFGQISVVTFEHVPRDRADEAAGLYSVMRTLGGAIGVALAGTIFVRQEQVHWNLLSGHVSDVNPDWPDWLARAGLSLDDASTPMLVARELLRQAQMQAFADLYWAIALSFLLLFPVVMALRRPARH